MVAVEVLIVVEVVDVPKGVGLPDGVAVMPIVTAGGGAVDKAEEGNLKWQQFHQYLVI